MPTEAPPKAIPCFRRARGFRLYDMQGRRYLDLFRDGALLGHRPPGALTAMKAVLSQGLAAQVPSAWEGRLAAQLARLFPAFPSVRLYATRERALGAVARWLGEPQAAALDPALCTSSPTPGLSRDLPSPRAAYWRPFLAVPAGARALLPILPLTVGGAPAPACFPAAAAQGLPGPVPASDTIPGFVCAGALRALAALSDPGWVARLDPADPRLAAALDGGRGWARVGPYVRALFPSEDYARVHAEFLRAGVLLCPAYPGPSILPGECSPGETSLLAELFAGLPGA